MRHRWLVAGPLLLVVLALGVTIVLILWSSPTNLRVGPGAGRLGQVAATADEEQQATVSGPVKLVVEPIPSGALSVTGGTTDTAVVVAARKTAWGASQAEAEARLATLQVVVTTSGETVTVRVEPPQERVVWGAVDLRITVPTTTTVTATTRAGAVTLSGTTGSAALRTAFGSIQVSDVRGGVSAQTGSGAVTLRAVRAGGEGLTARSNFGTVILADVAAGEIVAHSGSGQLDLTDVAAGGSLTATSNFGAVEIARGRAAGLTARTGAGQIRLTDLTVDGPALARSSHGAVTLTGVQAATYDVSSGSGSVVLDGVSGVLRAQSDFGDVRVTNAQRAQLDLHTRSGALAFAGSLGDGPHQLKSDFGDIRLQLPGDAALTVDLKTSLGGIRSSLPVTGQGTPSATHWRGTVNGGGASLTAITSNGSIALATLTP
jgi:DUF4097 and DUF4098 domain-containing protein YvlB